MKICQPCGATSDAATCPFCGEASWIDAPAVAPVIVPAAPVEEPLPDTDAAPPVDGSAAPAPRRKRGPVTP